MDELKLKEKLTDIKNEGWDLGTNIDAYELVQEMMVHIGSTDYVLRDDLIYTGFYYIIYRQKKLTSSEQYTILKRLLTDNYLFYNINKDKSDSVFRRTFTLLLIDVILSNDLLKNFLSKEEFFDCFQSIIKYVYEEKDLRGYVENKGWAHSTAHCADVLTTITENKYIEKGHLLKILDCIYLMSTNTEYVYINQENERLINVVEEIIEKKVLDDKYILDWINLYSDIDMNLVHPKITITHTNRKMFLQSLYFRFLNGSYNEEYVNYTNGLLRGFPKFY